MEGQINELEKRLLDAPSLTPPFCVFCGRKATNLHHVVFRSQGGTDGPVVSVCGMGNASGCHGKLHGHRLHLRYTDEWEFLETREAVKYQTALSMKGWRKLKRWTDDCCLW